MNSFFIYMELSFSGGSRRSLGLPLFRLYYLFFFFYPFPEKNQIHISFPRHEFLYLGYGELVVVHQSEVQPIVTLQINIKETYEKKSEIP